MRFALTVNAVMLCIAAPWCDVIGMQPLFRYA